MFFGGFGVDVIVVDNMVRVLWERTSEVVCFFVVGEHVGIVMTGTERLE